MAVRPRSLWRSPTAWGRVAGATSYLPCSPRMIQTCRSVCLSVRLSVYHPPSHTHTYCMGSCGRSYFIPTMLTTDDTDMQVCLSVCLYVCLSITPPPSHTHTYCMGSCGRSYFIPTMLTTDDTDMQVCLSVCLSVRLSVFHPPPHTHTPTAWGRVAGATSYPQCSPRMIQTCRSVCLSVCTSV